MIVVKCVFLCLALALGGCAAFQDAARGFAREMLTETVDVASERFGDEMGERIASLPVPEESDPSGQTLWYGVGGLIAYVLGSVGKGAIRKHFGVSIGKKEA